MHTAAYSGQGAVAKELIEENAEVEALTKVHIPSACEETFGKILIKRICLVGIIGWVYSITSRDRAWTFGSHRDITPEGENECRSYA